MYIINGIAYAGEQAPTIKVMAVRPLANYKLWLRFADGQERVFDFAPLLDETCYKPLRDKAVFDRVYLEYGAPVWNDGEIDIAPETLLEGSTATSDCVIA